VVDDLAFADPPVESIATVASPIGDVINGYTSPWLNQSGSSLNLWQSVDESTASATDYAESPDRPDGPNDGYTMMLGPVAVPVPTGAIIGYGLELGGSDVALDANVALYQENLLIAEWRESNVPVGPTPYSHALSAPQAASITDGRSLRLKVYGMPAGGGWYDDPVRSVATTLSGNSVNMTVNRPADYCPGDLFVAIFSGSSVLTIVPDGWVQFFDVGSLRVYTKVAVAGEPTGWVFQQTTAGAYSSNCAAIKYAPGAVLTKGTSYVSGGISWALPSVTATEPGQLVLAVLVASGNRTATIDNGFTEIIETNGTPSVYMAWKWMGTPGASGTATVTLSASSTGEGFQILVDRNL
jgi:hypothetical protein